MTLVGLTGGIGSGKSAVASILTARGYQLVDADVVARFVVEKGSPTLLRIMDSFGPDVLTQEGYLDRPKLGTIVFGDSSNLDKLNSIIHPAIAIEMQRRIEASMAADSKGMVFIDIPLLVETGGKARYHLDYVVVVDVPQNIQMDRLTRIRALSEDEARARINAQAKREDRLAMADFVVDNTGSLADLDERVDEMLAQLLRSIERG